MTSHPLPPPYDESAHLPVYDDVVIANHFKASRKAFAEKYRGRTETQ